MIKSIFGGIGRIGKCTKPPDLSKSNRRNTLKSGFKMRALFHIFLALDSTDKAMKITCDILVVFSQ